MNAVLVLQGTLVPQLHKDLKKEKIPWVNQKRPEQEEYIRSAVLAPYMPHATQLYSH